MLCVLSGVFCVWGSRFSINYSKGLNELIRIKQFVSGGHKDLAGYDRREQKTQLPIKSWVRRLIVFVVVCFCCFVLFMWKNYQVCDIIPYRTPPPPTPFGKAQWISWRICKENAKFSFTVDTKKDKVLRWEEETHEWALAEQAESSCWLTGSADQTCPCLPSTDPSRPFSLS